MIESNFANSYRTIEEPMVIAERRDTYGKVDVDELLKTLTEIKLRGSYGRPCPECGGELTGIDPEASSTFCEECDEEVEIHPLF